VSTWQIQLPIRDRSESLSVTASSARHLPTDEDRQVCRQLVIGALMRGARTVDDFLTELEGLQPAQRRELLDEARGALGLDSTKDVEDLRRYELANTYGHRHAEQTSAWQLCGADDCNASPVSELGVPIASTVRKWHCVQHRHLATADDLRPLGPRLGYSPAGVIVDLDEQEHETAFAQAEQRTRDAERAAREAAAAAVQQELVDLDEARRERFRRELPPHLQASA
jgi:hypothetical protein